MLFDLDPTIRTGPNRPKPSLIHHLCYFIAGFISLFYFRSSSIYEFPPHTSCSICFTTTPFIVVAHFGHGRVVVWHISLDGICAREINNRSWWYEDSHQWTPVHPPGPQACSLHVPFHTCLPSLSDFLTVLLPVSSWCHLVEYNRRTNDILLML